MEKIGNIKFYEDDNEIIDVLIQLPGMPDYGGMNVLKFMQEKTSKADFGGVIRHEDLIYTVYKFDKDLAKTPEDAGLILTVSSMRFAIEQLDIWKLFRTQGMSFSESIFNIISDALVAIFAVDKFYNKGK